MNLIVTTLKSRYYAPRSLFIESVRGYIYIYIQIINFILRTHIEKEKKESVQRTSLL